MGTTARILVVAAVLDHVVKSAGKTECPFWKNIVESPGFRQHVLAAARTARLDIGLPSEFGVEETRLLTKFLKSASVSARLFSDESGFCLRYQCDKVRNDRRAVLLPFCRTSVWTVLHRSIENPYVVYLYAFSANMTDYSNTTRRVWVSRLLDFRRLRGSGVFFFTLRAGRILVTADGSVRNLTYGEVAPSNVGITLFEHLPIGGIHVRIWCLHPYFCESPTFGAFREVLLHANATSEAIPIANKTAYDTAVSEVLTHPATLIYFNGFATVNVLFPATTIPCRYDLLTFFLYVKGPKALPKEVVLLLPFNTSVWVAFLVSLVLCLLFSFFVTRVLIHRPVRIQTLAILFAASFLRQAYDSPRTVSAYHSFRIIIGVWSLTAAITATAFQGLLVSLLWKTPLDSAYPSVDSVRHRGRHGFRVCFLTYPLDRTLGFPETKTPFHSYGSCVDQSGKIQFLDEAITVFFVFGSGFPRPEELKESLLQRGYVQLENALPSILSGPELRSTSPHRKAIGTLSKRAMEAGIFERSARVAQLKRLVKSEPPPDVRGLGDAPMKLSDLRPGFLVLLIGLALSCLTLALDVLICKMQHGIEKRRKVRKKESRSKPNGPQRRSSGFLERFHRHIAHT